MQGSGFFTTRSEREEPRKPKKGPAAVSLETLRKLGPAGVRSMNPKAKSPEMLPSGCKKPLVYILGEAPGQEDDKQDLPFVGTAGQYLRAAIPKWAEKHVRFDNCVRTRPPDNRKPKREEIECFRGAVEKSIEEAEPFVVLGVGTVALTWATGLTSIKASRGKMYPIQVGKHRCWFMPVLHPTLLIRIEKGREDNVPGREWVRYWKNDIRRAFDFAESEPAAPEILTPEQAREGTVYCTTIPEIAAAFKELGKSKNVGWDIETHRLRPYYEDSRILSCAFSNGETTYAFALDHDEAPWTPQQRSQLLRMIGEFLNNGPRIIAHNLPFEMEWGVHFFGKGIVRGDWGCSLNASYVLDPGPPGEGASGHALDDLCIREFGLRLKDMSMAGSLRDRLREVRLKDLLPYNALDAKMCLLLWRKLMPEVRKQGMLESYNKQIRRCPSIVLAQRVGIPVDQEETKRLGVSLKAEVDVLEAKVMSHEAIKKYKSNFGPFNPASNEQVSKLLTSTLGIEEAREGTSAKILQPLVTKHPIVGDILALRSLQKMRGTYIDRFRIEHPESYVFPDGRIHSEFPISNTRSFRLASENPNSQNWPKRKHKKIRKQLKAPPGWVFISVDQGQIEARTIAMESKDTRWIRVLTDDFDVHKHWAEKLAGISPKIGKLMSKAPKEARHLAKNQFVFPSFYGSSSKAIIRNLELPERQGQELFDEFWDEFAGIKKWQEESWEFYQENGYILSLTGRRRLGPLSFNMVVNTPSQADASDICVDAMNRLCDIALDQDASWLQPVIQIHDDLSFLVPLSEEAEALKVIVREQLGFQAPWVNVPLVVEAERGFNLCDMETVGKWDTRNV